MTVQLPPGVVNPTPRRATEGIPFGEGRRFAIDRDKRAYMAVCENARHQKSKPGKGRPTIFADADDLEHACREYMFWSDRNPLYEKVKKFSGTSCKFYDADIPKKRPYTVGGLCNYLGVVSATWDEWRKNDEFKAVTQLIDEAIRQQKFEGASSGFFNPAIIARDLGLVDKQEVTGANGGPQTVVTATMTAEDAAEAYRLTREG